MNTSKFPQQSELSLKKPARLKRLVGFSLFTAIIASSSMLVYAASAQQIIDFKTSEEIKKLNSEIEEKSSEIDSLSGRAEEYAKLIQSKQAEERSLGNELSIIDNRVIKTQLDVEKKEAEIEGTNLKIREAELTIDSKEGEIDLQKIQLGAFLREIHRQDQRGKLEIVLVNENISDFFGYVKRLEEVQANISVSLGSLKDAKRTLEISKFGLEKEKVELQSLVLELEIEQQKLIEEKTGKEFLLAETEQSEANFQNRLSEIRFQQRLADETIKQLEADIKEKLRKAQESNPSFDLNPGQIIWPIPNQGITTYYHDPTYPYRHIVGEHSGLDLRTLINGYPSMGLPLRAPADGIVVKTISNGRFTGNAIFVSHGDIMTVNYHLSEIWVSTDQFVSAGETIGLTGGAPGHPGAGLSSGPHLHFEVRKDGIPVDPCAYLSPSC